MKKKDLDIKINRWFVSLATLSLLELVFDTDATSCKYTTATHSCRLKMLDKVL